jgi:hypothetical protein
MMKNWTSPIYAFFSPIPDIEEIDECTTHVFKCLNCGCNTKIWHYLDKKDAQSTGNMRKHAKSCWGDDAVNAADEAKDTAEVCKKIIGKILQNGSITATFERKGKGVPTYLNCPHTRSEIQYVSSLHVLMAPDQMILKCRACPRGGRGSETI